MILVNKHQNHLSSLNKTRYGDLKMIKNKDLNSSKLSKKIKKMVEALKQIPSVKLDGEEATEENFSIYLNIAEPIPLDNILQELSLVESSDVRGDTIKLKLKNNNNNDI